MSCSRTQQIDVAADDLYMQKPCSCPSEQHGPIDGKAMQEAFQTVVWQRVV